MKATRRNSAERTASARSGMSCIVLGDSRRANYGIATAAPAKDSEGWVGVAFGGGAYVEAQRRFDPAASRDVPQKGRPAFWGMAIEHLAALPGEQWPGQPQGYQRFIAFSAAVAPSR